MNSFRQPFQKEWPITQFYGEKYTSAFHTGIDYGCPEGTEILSSANGVVIYTGFEKNGYGNYVIIQHDKNIATLYAHLKDVYVAVGKIVKQGELIGHSGNTGYSTGPHLHFEARTVWSDSRTHIDPMSLGLRSVDDTVQRSSLLRAEDLKPGIVEIVAPSGAFVHNSAFTEKNVFPYGTKFVYLGESIRQNNLEFCKCEVWIAVNDGETQILKNS